MSRPSWMLREPPALFTFNFFVCFFLVLAKRKGVRLAFPVAVMVASGVLIALTVLNAVSARLFAKPGNLVYWPIFWSYEILAFGAAWAAWSLREAD